MSGGEHNLISFVGDVAISNIDDAYAEFGGAFRAGGAVVVDIDGVAETDLSFIQLIEAARLKAAETGRDFTLRRPAGGAVLEVLRRGGFLDDGTSDRTKFWLQGAAQ